MSDHLQRNQLTLRSDAAAPALTELLAKPAPLEVAKRALDGCPLPTRPEISSDD
jgi:hypothetical protein